MEVLSVHDAAFRPYGRVLTGYDTEELRRAMSEIPLPERGTAYEPSIDALERCAVFHDLRNRAYGGMPVELGMCWGRNTKLNCLEYHRDSELNIGERDYILLVAHEWEIEDGALDTGKVKAFRAGGGEVVEVFATTLHYAPCQTDEHGFRVAVVLPRGTNTAAPELTPRNEEDYRLRARNKWLLAHPDAPEAKDGAVIGLRGDNIDIAKP